MEKLKVVMLLYPDLTLQDFIGPYDVFIRSACFQVCSVALNKMEMRAEGGLVLRANYDFEDCPAADILFVPGGKGVTSLLGSKPYLDFLRKQSENTQYITSVCTGALLLAAAGLLTGYPATTHWRSAALLEMFAVEFVDERVVIDRNRITGGGITAGIDFGLVLTALIAGEDQAKVVQLMLEYDPQPPFSSGSVKTAETAILNLARERTQESFDRRRNIIRQITGEA